MAVDDGRNLTEAARSTQSQARFTFKPRTVLNHRATRTHNRHVWVSAHHGCDEVLESVNDGGWWEHAESSQIDLHIARANIWLNAHATHVVVIRVDRWAKAQ